MRHCCCLGLLLIYFCFSGTECFSNNSFKRSPYPCWFTDYTSVVLRVCVSSYGLSYFIGTYRPEAHIQTTALDFGGVGRQNWKVLLGSFPASSQYWCYNIPIQKPTRFELVTGFNGRHGNHHQLLVRWLPISSCSRKFEKLLSYLHGVFGSGTSQSSRPWA